MIDNSLIESEYIYLVKKIPIESRNEKELDNFICKPPLKTFIIEN